MTKKNSNSSGNRPRASRRDMAVQPNALTNMHRTGDNIYTERAIDSVVQILQPYYKLAKQRENHGRDQRQLMLDFHFDDAYIVKEDNGLEHTGDLVATIRFRDLPGVSPNHYAEVRQLFKDALRETVEIRTERGVKTRALFYVIQEYETREIRDSKTGEIITVRGNQLKKNEIKIGIDQELMANGFFLTQNGGYTQFYFPTTRHTKTTTANRIYKFLCQQRGMNGDLFRVDYTKVREQCGLWNSEDGSIINGVNIVSAAAKIAKKDGLDWAQMKPTERDTYLQRSRTKAEEKYAYYSEFAKRYLAQAKKELDDLVKNFLTNFTFDYKPIFSDGRAKGKIPKFVEFTILPCAVDDELVADRDLDVKEVNARELMEKLKLQAAEINTFIRRLCIGDIDHLLVKLRQLIRDKENVKTDLHNWAKRSISNFFKDELPGLRGFTPAEEVREQGRTQEITIADATTKRIIPEEPERVGQRAAIYNALGEREVFTDDEQRRFNAFKEECKLNEVIAPHYDKHIAPLFFHNFSRDGRTIVLYMADSTKMTIDRLQYLNIYLTFLEVFHRHFPDLSISFY